MWDWHNEFINWQAVYRKQHAFIVLVFYSAHSHLHSQEGIIMLVLYSPSSLAQSQGVASALPSWASLLLPYLKICCVPRYTPLFNSHQGCQPLPPKDHTQLEVKQKHMSTPNLQVPFPHKLKNLIGYTQLMFTHLGVLFPPDEWRPPSVRLRPLSSFMRGTQTTCQTWETTVSRRAGDMWYMVTMPTTFTSYNCTTILYRRQSFI